MRREIRIDAVAAAQLLREELVPYGIAADVHSGDGVAIISVWVELVVWTEGRSYWWATGRDSGNGRRLYTRHATSDPRGAARRIAGRCVEVRQRHPLSGLFDDMAA